LDNVRLGECCARRAKVDSDHLCPDTELKVGVAEKKWGLAR